MNDTIYRASSRMWCANWRLVSRNTRELLPSPPSDRTTSWPLSRRSDIEPGCHGRIRVTQRFSERVGVLTWVWYYQDRKRLFFEGEGRCWLLINPFGSDQFQISPAASPEILHHTVWRISIFIDFSDKLKRWLYYQFSQPHLYISL